jgi:spore maturation protein CgeB
MTSASATSLALATPSTPSPRLLTSLLPSTPVLAQVAYYSNAAGLIFMAPALITGFHEFYEIYKHLGTKRVEDGVVLQSYPQRTFNVAAIHGVLNALTGELYFVLLQAFCFTRFVSRL